MKPNLLLTLILGCCSAFLLRADNTALESVLAAQPQEAQARYQYRNPQQTLEFFGVQPGMTVVEALPGGGWYSKILLAYLGTDGRLVGADYAVEMFPLFGFFSDAAIEKKKTWATDWPAEAATWVDTSGAAVAAFNLGSMPSEFQGQADAVLFIRALHNLARFEGEGGFLSAALADAHAALKPGGVLGIVQHEARSQMPDDWATGSHGYLKREFVIEQVEAAGFEFVAAADFNANSKDQPAVGEVVWRLPPTYSGSRDKPEVKAQMEVIGESNRMTLKFRKPD